MFIYERTKNCTYQLPRKRSELPQPCPLCGRTYGTVQIVVFNPKAPHRYRRTKAVIFRIGHYDANRYASTSEVQKSTKREPRVKHPSGRIWHSFKTRLGFTISEGEKKVRLEDYFQLEDDYIITNTSKTFKFENDHYDYVKQFGWRMVPDKGDVLGLRIKRRAPKQHPKDINEKQQAGAYRRAKKEPINIAKGTLRPLFPNKYPD